MRPRIISDSLSLMSEVEEMGVSFSPKDVSHNKKDFPESKPKFTGTKDTLEFFFLDQCGSPTVV